MDQGFHKEKSNCPVMAPLCFWTCIPLFSSLLPVSFSPGFISYPWDEINQRKEGEQSLSCLPNSLVDRQIDRQTDSIQCTNHIAPGCEAAEWQVKMEWGLPFCL
jgi:hypothetical protein